MRLKGGLKLPFAVEREREALPDPPAYYPGNDKITESMDTFARVNGTPAGS